MRDHVDNMSPNTADGLHDVNDTDTDMRTPTEMTAPPDGGWGWVVCFACFMTHVLTDGTFFSLGIIFVELLDYYQEKKSSTAFIASLSFGVCLLSGPFNAAMSNHFGYRKTTIFGTLLMSVSFICSIFAPNVFYLYLTFGISGLGFGMVYLCSIVCLTSYFEKRRAFAVGLGVSGSGIGTFVFGLMTRALIDAYTWKGAVLIQGGLMLNCVACGMVYLPLDHIVNRRRQCAAGISSNNSSKGAETDMNLMCSNNRSDDVNHDSYNDLNEMEQLQTHDEQSLHVHDEQHLRENMTTESFNDDSSRPMLNIHDSNAKTHVTEFGGPDTLSTEEHEIANRNPGASTDDRRLFVAVLDSLKQSCSLSVFKNIAFLLYIVSTIFYSVGFYVPYLFLPDKAELSGINSYMSASLISSIGISNTAGRIIFGFISDMKCINRLFLYNSALLVCGVGTVICAFLESYGALLTYTVIFGLFTGVTISLTSVIVADLVGIDMLAGAFGAMNFFAGAFTFLGPPIGGWLFDSTNSYDIPFVAAGVAIAFSGAMLFVLPLIRTQST